MGSEATKGKGAVTGGDVVVYEEKGGRVRLEVRLEGETVWLSLTQMAELFGRDKSVISRHLRGVFATGELSRAATVAENATVQREGGRAVTRQIEYFNLDAVLSVGYRVNSKRGTQFRIWATGKLREHLLRGYTLNERRLREKGMGEMEQAVGLLARTLKRHELVTDEGRAVLDVVEQYARSWRLLLEYDERRLAEAPRHPRKPTGTLPLESARSAIGSLRQAVAPAGGRPACSARSVAISWDGMLVRADGAFRLADSTMVALALLVAESEPKQKDLMIRLVLSLLEDGQ